MRTLSLALVALLVVACGHAPTTEPVDPAVYAKALAAPGRLAKDHERDASRKPAEVMAFFGIRPGMRVLDMFSGGGYSTEYAAWVVGPSGRVVAFNPTAYLDLAKDELAERFAPGRLANVSRVSSEVADFKLAPNSIDAAFMLHNYHDVYFVHEPTWHKVDGPRLLAAIKAALKPGAVFGIVDHAAAAGTGTASAQTMHRIEESVVIKDLTAAGFVLDGESKVLVNPADDHSKSVFDPAIRGQTDQFVLRFRKPAK